MARTKTTKKTATRAYPRGNGRTAVLVATRKGAWI
jgi:hypothetical protein